MRLVRGVASVCAAAAGIGAVMGTAYGLEDGLITAGLVLVCGAAVLGLAELLVRRRARVGPLARQFQLGIALVIGLALLGVGLIALLMFISAHDALLIALLLAFAGALAAYCASAIASGVMRDIESVRDSLRAVGSGRRDVRSETGADDELAELADAANGMTDQIIEGEARVEAAWSAHRDLIAAVSHDLRTPLTSLRVLSEAIEDEVGDGDTRQRYREQMSIQIRSLGALVDDLFELSRLEAGDVEWSMQQVHLGELVSETVEAMQAQAEAKGVAMRADVPEDTTPARGNPEKVQRVLFNLMQNAIRHTPPDGSVTVVAESLGRCVEIEVADSGGGVHPADRERIFDAFYRAGEEAPRTRTGAGLGLTICRAIVEAHGGRIWLAGSGPGTRIRFSLPTTSA